MAGLPIREKALHASARAPTSRVGSEAAMPGLAGRLDSNDSGLDSPDPSP